MYSHPFVALPSYFCNILAFLYTYTVRLAKIKAYLIPSSWEQLDQLRLSKQSIRLCNQLSDWSRCILITLIGGHCLSPGRETWHTVAKGVKHNFVKCNFPPGVDRNNSGGMTVPVGRNCQCRIFEEFYWKCGRLPQNPGGLTCMLLYLTLVLFYLFFIFFLLFSSFLF